MAYSPIEVDFTDHPKTVAAGPLAELLQIRAVLYANQYLTDGYLPAAVIPRLTRGFERLEIDGTPADEIDWPAVMLKHRFWERGDDGYRIHDFLVYNRPRSVVEALRAKAKANGRAGGQASAQARAQGIGSVQAKAQPSAQAHWVDPASASQTDTKRNHLQDAQANGQPLAQASASGSIEQRRRELQDKLFNEHPEWSSRQVEDEAIRLAIEPDVPF